MTRWRMYQRTGTYKNPIKNLELKNIIIKIKNSIWT